MAPSFLNFKELRRRSRASFRTENSTDASSDGTLSHDTTPSSGSLTPPSIAHHSDPALNLQVKHSNASQGSFRQSLQRPSPFASANTSRHSFSNMSAGAPSIPGKPSLPVSPYAPYVHNITENSWVYQKAIIAYGTIGETGQHPFDGTLIVSRRDDSLPPTKWPVCDSHFKALIYLQPGVNKIRFDFSSPKLPNSSSSSHMHTSYLTLHMMPNMSAPPLQLAIVLAKDSPGTYDALPAKAEREGNGIETAIAKFRMGAYLWQAFTAEQMWRNKLGRRAFRFEEEWVPGTVMRQDQEEGTMRSEARIHVIRSDRTVAEMRDLNKAQQYDGATDKNALFGIAAEAVKKHFNPPGGQKQYVSVLLLDTHWDKNAKTITGHAALGGAAGDLHLGVFGSHCLQSYPSTIDEVVPAFTDCTPTDTNFVANDSGEAGSSWEAANIGIGAHLHETGHLFGCPHQESGIMARDYVVFNRTFVPREAFSTRTKSRGGLALQGDECGWHRLDCLRFRAHPSFRLPNDPPVHSDISVQAFAVERGNVLVMASTGISFVEIFSNDEDICRSWIECNVDHGPLQRQIMLSDQELRARLPAAKRKGRLRVSIKSNGGGSLTIDDFKTFTSKDSLLKLTNGQLASRSRQVGNSSMPGSESEEVIFSSATKKERIMSRVNVYHGSAVDGMEFVYEDGSHQLIGKKGGRQDVFEFDIRRGEYLSGLVMRAGAWIDGLQILSSQGRKSPMFGNARGGSAHTLIPPRGYTICGVSGTCGDWLDGFSILIKR